MWVGGVRGAPQGKRLVSMAESNVSGCFFGGLGCGIKWKSGLSLPGRPHQRLCQRQTTPLGGRECVRVRVLGPGRGWGPAPLICQSGQEQVTHLALRCPSTFCSCRGGEGCLLWLTLLAEPQIPAHHAPALLGTPGLRSGAPPHHARPPPPRPGDASPHVPGPPAVVRGPCTLDRARGEVPRQPTNPRVAGPGWDVGNTQQHPRVSWKGCARTPLLSEPVRHP